MENIGEFLANTYIIFIIIAIFAILALIGYIVEGKTGVRKRIVISSSKPNNDVDNDLQKLKNDLATSNKGLGSMVTNQNNPTNSPNNNTPPNVINFNQNSNSGNQPDKL